MFGPVSLALLWVPILHCIYAYTTTDSFPTSPTYIPRSRNGIGAFITREWPGSLTTNLTWDFIPELVGREHSSYLSLYLNVYLIRGAGPAVWLLI